MGSMYKSNACILIILLSGQTFSDTKLSLVNNNGSSRVLLSSFEFYITGVYKYNKCQLHQNDDTTDQRNSPKVAIAIAIPEATPFLEEFFDSIVSLKYPKEKLGIFIYNNVEYHDEIIQLFMEKHGSSYSNAYQIRHIDSYTEAMARSSAVIYAERENCDYLFVLDAEAHIDNPFTLIRLLDKNWDVIAPMMTRYKSSRSNFWAALSVNGSVAPSNDYRKIVRNEIRGLWNVPFISSCYLIKKAVFPQIVYADDTLEANMAMCKSLRAQQISMYVDNEEHYGHLVNNTDFNPALTQPEFHMLLSNQKDWETRYIHRDYFNLLKPKQRFEQPCPDVFWFPIASNRFCDDLVKIVEACGNWSDGSNQDKRIEGGYESAPTRDIHMSQVGLEAVWLKFLRDYVRPLQQAVFAGYDKDPPRSHMNFIVRYKPDEQASLIPHFDDSLYSINMALNRVGIDYEGGGCQFLRYNCSVTATRKGWMLMHPGRLTHSHQGLKTTRGIRYIMISFIDP